PPGRKPAQPVHRTPTGKGAAIVTADGSRQSVALKETFKILLHRYAPGVLQGPQFQQVATVFIAYRQRFAPLQPIVPPAFEIHRPDLIGSLGLPAAAQPPALTSLAHLAFLGQTTAFQHPLETAVRSQAITGNGIHDNYGRAEEVSGRKV